MTSERKHDVKHITGVVLTTRCVLVRSRSFRRPGHVIAILHPTN